MRLVKSIFVGAILMILGTENAKAGLTFYEPGFTPILRGSGFQSYPLAVDASGNVYTVTGTSPSDQLLEITTSGQVLTINPAVGGVIGTHAKLAFGFGGSLFATSFGAILEFSLPSGTRTSFYSGPVQGDAGLVFDSSRQLLWAANAGPTSNDIIGLDANGNVVETIQNASISGYSMALDKAGDLILLRANGILESIDPATKVVTQLADLTSIIPQANIRSLAINPDDGIFYFSNQYGGPDPTYIAFNGLYRINPDGTDLTLVATGFGGQMTFGASSAGDGRTSIYLGDSGNYQLFEVQSGVQSVPEPSSLLMSLTGVIGFAAYGFVARSRRRIS